MATETLNQSEQDSQLSRKQASEIFSILFEDPKNIDAARSLFEGLPGLARQQQIEKTIQMAKGGLKNLKNNIA